MLKPGQYLKRDASPQGERITSGVPMPGAVVMRALKVGNIDKEKRTLELSFSSDEEAKRWPGFIEVLDHSAGAADLSRLNANGPLLFNHKLDDVIGVIENASIGAKGKGRALVRFSRSARAEEVWNDVQDGILKNVSVGYRINEVKLSEQRENGDDVYVVTKWEPYEISIVSAPLDISVGIGRALESTPNKKESQTKLIMTKQQMIAWLVERGISASPETSEAELLRQINEYRPAPAPTPTPEPPAFRSLTQITNDNTAAATAERSRISAITAAGKQFKCPELAERAIEAGQTVSEFNGVLLAEVGRRDAQFTTANATIGLTAKEAKSFSFVRLLRSLSDPQDRAAREGAAFELDVCNTAAGKRGVSSKGTYVPPDVLRVPLMDGKRDIVSILEGSGYTGDGGNTVATTLLTQSFWQILRNRSVALGLFTPMSGLVGNIDVPYQTGGSAAAWLGSEDAAAALTDVNFDLRSLSPKTLACYSEITRKMLQQSSIDIEAFVRADMARGMALKLDHTAFYGTGSSGIPTGIKSTTGIQAVDWAAVNPTWAKLVEMETEVAADNIDAATSRYIFNARMKGHFKTTRKFSDSTTDGIIWEGDGVNGYKAEITNQITNGDVFFGDFSEMWYATWGGLDILVDPYTHSSRGRIRITNFMDADFQVRRAEALAYGSDVTPA